MSRRQLSDLDEKTRACGGDLRALEAEADRMCDNLERTRVLDRAIVCVDADAFYASVEERDNPDLKDKVRRRSSAICLQSRSNCASQPFAVGGGVLTTANYVARRWVRRRLPGAGKQLTSCPGLCA